MNHLTLILTNTYDYESSFYDTLFTLNEKKLTNAPKALDQPKYVII